jgi:hypothetical protein
MELRIKPFPKNKYPRKGLLIKGSSLGVASGNGNAWNQFT